MKKILLDTNAYAGGTIGDRPRFFSYLIRIRILSEKKKRGLSPIVTLPAETR